MGQCHRGRLQHRQDPLAGEDASADDRRHSRDRRRPGVRQFKAYDAETGAILWKFQAGAGVNAPPSSYTVDGKQYIVVAAGGNAQLDYKRGNNIIAFTIDP